MVCSFETFYQKTLDRIKVRVYYKTVLIVIVQLTQKGEPT